ncbi:MAG: pentapeptide repeat-containing protein [Microcystaceae cyanobacterium]
MPLTTLSGAIASMVQSSTAQEVQEKYQAGERNFQGVQLRREDLHGLTLEGADFSGADFTDANLREANLKGTNLEGAYCNGADLSSANLEKANLKGASLIKTYLIKVNLQGANLEAALCTGAFLTRANLQLANLNGTYFNGASLTGANLTNARYNNKTRFDATFNLAKSGLKKVGEVAIPTAKLTKEEAAIAPPIDLSKLSLTVEDLLLMWNHLSDIGDHYLGNTMTSRYFESTKPSLEWFGGFEINRSTAKVTYQGSIKEKMTPAQIELAQEWAKKFVKSCTMIFKDFTKMIESEQLVFPVV